jgi:hypothetical protein
MPPASQSEADVAVSVEAKLVKLSPVPLSCGW